MDVSNKFQNLPKSPNSITHGENIYDSQNTLMLSVKQATDKLCDVSNKQLHLPRSVSVVYMQNKGPFFFLLPYFLQSKYAIKRLARQTAWISVELQLALSVSRNQPHYISICNQQHSWRPYQPFIPACRDKSAVTPFFHSLGLNMTPSVSQP